MKKRVPVGLKIREWHRVRAEASRRRVHISVLLREWIEAPLRRLPPAQGEPIVE
jgi:hypothetical protein